MNEELQTKLDLHLKWINGDPTGKRADLWEANLRGANLRGANLREADLRGANLWGANLREADLRGADLREADLWVANLREADLRGANLWEADLRGADLRGANLLGADLREADLRGANLRGANLDFSTGLFFGCKSFNFRADLRLAAQIAYHFCKIDFGDCHEAKEAQKALVNLANKFHRVGECGKNEMGEESP